MPKKKRSGSSGGLQVPLFELESSWRPPSLGDLPSWAGAKRVGFDFETRDPFLDGLGPGVERDDSYVVGFSFAIEDGPSHYVPLRHEGGDNVEDPGLAWQYLRDQAREFDGFIVGMNLGYELRWAWKNGVHFPKVKRFRDVSVADPLINELHLKYNLNAIAERWGLPGKDRTKLIEAARHFDVDPAKGLWRLAARYVGAYGDRDSVLPLQILRRQEREIEKQDLWEVFDLESDVLPVLARMSQRGVLVDLERLRGVEEWSLAQETEALEKVRHLSGRTITVGDVWKPGALAPALEAIGVEVPFTVRGKKNTKTYSIDQEFLVGVDHEVAESIAWARKVNKLRTTFASSIRKHMVNGRIHCTFNQLRRTKEDGNTRGAAYGRLSSENPNMQQQPARDEFAAMWRSIYRPEEGSVWGADDYSQQEPRWLVHFAELMRLPMAYEAAQRYRDDPSTDNHQMMADLTGVPRKQAKELLLGKCYGMGGAKLCRKLGLPTRWAVYYRGWERETEYFEHAADSYEAARRNEGRAFEAAGEEGQAIIDKFDAKLPFVREIARRAQRQAQRRGYVKTHSGRRCRFPQRDDGTYDWTQKALNRVIQGSSADQTKRALVEGDRAGYHIQLQVHDEIDGSFADRAEAQGLGEVMRTCYSDLRVPFKVDVEVGPSWGEAA